MSRTLFLPVDNPSSRRPRRIYTQSTSTRPIRSPDAHRSRRSRVPHNTLYLFTTKRLDRLHPPHDTSNDHDGRRTTLADIAVPVAAAIAATTIVAVGVPVVGRSRVLARFTCHFKSLLCLSIDTINHTPEIGSPILEHPIVGGRSGRGRGER